ncbi:uncharacterized protein LOC6564563 [Drosophila grimshawi]|uniref:GH12915 n=1 Tax=Drosophila grimshawi TaxID=7222 RepID=B4JIT6_DROGR|nr:uncharacterized protein LOC6564563 [Drosophila grimshawi]EDW00533.1 GH12915 [Drosophila grimshawi]
MSKQQRHKHHQHQQATTSHYEQEQEQEQEEEQQAEQEYDPLANLLSLQLKKPTHWNWELSTSRSCSNIALPRILLYDHTGALLLDADGHKEQTYRAPSSIKGDRRRKRAATANLSQSLQQARLPSEFNGLRIAEATPTPTSTPTTTPKPRRQQQLAGSCIDFSTHELPDWQPHGTSAGSSRRSSSLRGVRFEDQALQSQLGEQLEQRGQATAYPTPPSTSTLTTTANSSSSGPREKRRYRRSQSSGQRSILERFSMSRGRHSSPEYVIQEHRVEHGPRYFLRSSKAGTLVIQDDSFSRVRQRRRRQRHHSSSENNMHQPQQDQASNGVAQVAARRRPQQRAATLLAETTSDEEAYTHRQPPPTRQSRCRRTDRSCLKDVLSQELITIDPDNCVHRTAPGAT